MQKTKIKDIILGLDNLSFQQTLEFLVKKASEKGSKAFIATVNPEIIMLELGDREYERVINSANLRTADGVGVLMAGKIMGKSFKERIAGADITERLCREVAEKPITVGFLGGEPHVAEKTAECLVSKYPGLKVSFTAQDIIGDVPKSSQDLRLKIKDLRKEHSFINHKSLISIHEISADILFVAFGSPKQEKWIYQNLPKLDVRVAIGVGGTFDYISGKVRRAPVFVRKLGLEWLFRLIIQPWRIKRQLKLIQFLLLAIKERLFE